MPTTLASLRIRNLALVEDITWEPRPGFTALTGETGAGKSVLLGALALILGDRADKTIIRSGTDACAVEAVFEGVEDPWFARWLDESGADPCEGGHLILKRTVAAEGPGRQFVNGSAVPLSVLRGLGDRLVDLHGPHDHQSLYSREQQTLLLDRFAGTTGLREDFVQARRRLNALRDEQSALVADASALEREIDLLTHQSTEIKAANPDPGEEERLMARLSVARNARRIGEVCGQLEAVTGSEDGGLASQAAAAARLTRDLVRLDPSAEHLQSAAEAVFVAAEELGRSVGTYVSSLDGDPADLAEIEERLDLLETLKRKYGRTIEEVLAFGEQAAARLATLAGRGERRGSLESEIAAAAGSVRDLGSTLGRKRAEAAERLTRKVREGPKGLGFAKAEFTLTLEAHDEPTPHGYETAEFQFAPNPGEPPRPLRSIGSSGEISRVMLALKGALAAQDEIPVLVFDEIDANVGGEVASRVGEKMRQLGQGRQVVCITHFPPVAAAADSRFVVTKEISGDRTRTLLTEATGKTREQEIARMLGGQSATSLALARSLLEGR